ncbi:MAG TPA: hypothetical protein VK070_02820 [Acidimicrobiia bacterium]|jgi:hypothetical protein|nr:hypothetical protein [Acidimicrobiia bacterium]
MIDVAYLRVYRPADQVRLPVTSSALDVPRLSPAALTTESQTADAWEVEWDGALWRCPRAPRRRMLESLVAYHQATSRFGASIVDGGVAESARRELTRIRIGVGEPAAVMVSAWHPPLRWFIPFVPEDTVEPMVLRKDLGQALARLDEVITTMRRLDLPEAWIDDLATLENWLDSFSGRAMVELDYRQVGWRLGSTMIDDTTFDVASSVDALIDGDLETAGHCYSAALFRWADAQAVAYSS